MLMTELIAKKRDGGVLTAEEIGFMIDGYTRGNIPDYQMSAMLMAMYFRGLDRGETVAMTMAMMRVLFTAMPAESDTGWLCPMARMSWPSFVRRNHTMKTQKTAMTSSVASGTRTTPPMNGKLTGTRLSRMPRMPIRLTALRMP